jgi:uncharacterized protein (DUF305 family)
MSVISELPDPGAALATAIIEAQEKEITFMQELIKFY